MIRLRKSGEYVMNIERAEKLIDELEQDGFYYDDSVVGDAEKFKMLCDEFLWEILGEFAKLCGGFIKKR